MTAWVPFEVPDEVRGGYDTPGEVMARRCRGCVPARTGGALTAMPRLMRLALRRDRLVLSAWLVGLTVVGGATVNTVTGLDANEAERIAAAAFSAGNPIARVQRSRLGERCGRIGVRGELLHPGRADRHHEHPGGRSAHLS